MESHAAPTPAPAPSLASGTVTLTFYTCYGQGGGYCGTMSSGNNVYEGAVACGYAYELGQRLTIAGDPTGRVYVCEDRGLGPWYWVDVFWWHYADGRAWRNGMPLYATVRLVE